MTPLGANQAAVLAALEEQGELSTLDAGRLLHERRRGPQHVDREGPCCEYVIEDGRQVLESLRKRRLVERRKPDSVWVLKGAAGGHEITGQGEDIGF